MRVDGKDTTNVVDVLIREVQRLPEELTTSLTWDRGMELARHRAFTVATDVAVYFCDPQSLGSAAATKTPMGCCASTSQRVPIYRATANPNSMR